jgi:hypothetical protein
VGSRPCSPRVPFEGLDWVGELPARESTSQPGGGHLELGSGEVATPARKQAALGVAVGVHGGGGGGMLTRSVVVGDSPRGPLKQRGKPHLKPATRPKRVKPNHAGA